MNEKLLMENIWPGQGKQKDPNTHTCTHDTGFEVFTNIHEPGTRYIFITFFCLSIFHAKFNTSQVLRKVKGKDSEC